MAKNKNTAMTIGDLIDGIKDDIQVSSKEQRKTIPDIITFVEKKEWLGLPYSPTNPINLYPVQKIMLKAFYRGSIGNEDIFLTDEEIRLCKEIGLDTSDKGNVLEKYESGELFRELVLVWGRRSGKDFCVSVIAAYEAMKLLECDGGDPYALYELSAANTINILTIANSAPQSRLAFLEIRERILQSPYFSDKYVKEGITNGAFYLLTPKDKEDNIIALEKGLPTKKGSVAIIVGHSNSDSLLGMGCVVLILDEVASFKMTGSASSGNRIYAALTPTTQTYVKKTYETDEDGHHLLNEFGQKIIKDRRYDGKIISISSPRAPEGKFYELYKDASSVPSRLVIRCATWDVNPTHTRQSLREDNNTLTETEFMMEFGAEFSGASSEHFFTEDQLRKVFVGHNYKLVEMGTPGRVYFVHIDPATSSHNYALVVLHKEMVFNQEARMADSIIVVDHIKYWQPVNGPIDVNKVTDYIIGLKRRFHIGMLTHDQFSSQESIEKLRKEGIPIQLTRFTSNYKMNIYKELENLVNAEKIFIPLEEKSNLLYQEMVELQRKFTHSGFKVIFKKDGDGAKSDDIVDCLAGACYKAIDANTRSLPHGKLIEFGNNANNQVWRGMQGVIGIGSGSQIASQLENGSSVMRNHLNRK